MREYNESLWGLFKFRIKWTWEHYFRYTILPTWRYNYNLSREWESGSEFKKDLLTQVRALQTYIERIEGSNKALETIADNQRRVIRKYVKFFRTFGLSEEVLDKDYHGTGTTFNLVEVDLHEIPNEEDGKRVGDQEEQGEDTRETPGD